PFNHIEAEPGEAQKGHGNSAYGDKGRHNPEKHVKDGPLEHQLGRIDEKVGHDECRRGYEECQVRRLQRVWSCYAGRRKGAWRRRGCDVTKDAEVENEKMRAHWIDAGLDKGRCCQNCEDEVSGNGR